MFRKFTYCTFEVLPRKLLKEGLEKNEEQIKKEHHMAARKVLISLGE